MQAILDISDVLQQLHAAGHPKHQHVSGQSVHELVDGVLHLQETACDLQQTLSKWQVQIQELHSTFTHTEFLSIHQLVTASELLQVLEAEGTYSICKGLHVTYCNAAFF